LAIETFMAKETIAIATESPISIGTARRGGRVGLGILCFVGINVLNRIWDNRNLGF